MMAFVVVCCNTVILANEQASCPLKHKLTAILSAVANYNEITLDNGKHVHLINLWGGTNSDQSLKQWRSKMKSWLERHIGKEITLQLPTPKTDQFGRYRAQIHIDDIWVQKHFISQGWAKVMGLLTTSDCVPQLLKTEQTARALNKELWKDEHHQLLDAKEPQKLMQHLHQFIIGKGIVRSAKKSRKGFFLNFGDDWSKDMSLYIENKTLKQNSSLQISRKLLEQKQGQCIMFRGWLEKWNGPFLKLDHLNLLTSCKEEK